jgi:hypothetical protein
MGTTSALWGPMGGGGSGTPGLRGKNAYWFVFLHIHTLTPWQYFPVESDRGQTGTAPAGGGRSELLSSRTSRDLPNRV